LDTKEKAKFVGMKRKLETPNFIQNLGLMYDALEELALQRADITLTAATKPERRVTLSIMQMPVKA